MLMLVLSIAALALGPLLVGLRRPFPAAEPALDGFVVVSIGGLVLLDIIPDSVQAAGMVALVAAVVGVVVPIIVHRLWHGSDAWGERALLAAAVLGLAAHGLLDGLALRPPLGVTATALGAAVVVHQGPLGAGLWWLLSERIGRGATALVFGVLIGATIAGFLLQPWLAAATSTRALQIGQALLAGSLFHVVLEHRPKLADTARAERLFFALGAAAGVGVLSLLWRLSPS